LEFIYSLTINIDINIDNGELLQKLEIYQNFQKTWKNNVISNLMQDIAENMMDQKIKSYNLDTENNDNKKEEDNIGIHVLKKWKIWNEQRFIYSIEKYLK